MIVVSGNPIAPSWKETLSWLRIFYAVDETYTLSAAELLIADAGTCVHCKNPSSGQKEFDTTSLSPNLSISKVWKQDGNGSRQPNIKFDPNSAISVSEAPTEKSDEDALLSIQWNNDVFPDHVTTFRMADIRSLAYGRSQADRIMTVPWDSGYIYGAYDEGILSARYEDYLHSDVDFARIIRTLEQVGLAFIDDVPRREDAVEQIGQRIGPLRHTFYGRTWDVKDKPNAENVAYTATELGLHMDLMYGLLPKQGNGMRLTE